MGLNLTAFDPQEDTPSEVDLQQGRQRKLELDRQIAEAAQTEFRLAAIVESSEDAIISKTLEGIITTWNAAANRMFGYRPEEIIGKSVLMLVRSELHDEEMEILARLKAGERIENYDTRRITKSGRLIDLSLTISPIKNAVGRVIGASTIARDITERKQMEEALRTSERYAAMGRVAAVLAHEINNPLEAVTNTFYLLRRDPTLDQQHRQLLRIAETELSRVNHITKQTLGLYRQSDRPALVSLNTLLDDILEVFERKLHTSKISVEKRFATEGRILGFPVEIRQVFLNLVSNAIQAMPNGGTLRIHLYPSQDRSRRGARSGVRVSVIDTGVGIAPEALHKLFQPFFTTKAEKGTGLGLWVSRGIVQKLEGSIRVRSRIRMGKAVTCFSVFLPGGEELQSQKAA